MAFKYSFAIGSIKSHIPTISACRSFDSIEECEKIAKEAWFRNLCSVAEDWAILIMIDEDRIVYINKFQYQSWIETLSL